MKKIVLMIPALALLFGCGARKQDSGTEVFKSMTKVRVAEATSSTVPMDDVYSSTVNAFAVNNIAPQSAGRIRTIKVDVGSFVVKGQELAVMDDLQLLQAELRLANEKTEYERIKALLDEGGVSQSDFDQIEMALKVDENTVANLRQNTYLCSPVTGVVTARNYDQGDMYSMAQPIFTVQQITPVKLLVAVSETDYPRVKVGQSVEITAEAIPGKVFDGKIAKVHPTMDAVSHTFNAEIHVPNYDRLLRPGMFARVKVDFGSHNSIVIPDDAIVKQQGSGVRSVFILNEDGETVKLKSVTLGRHFERSYEILGGLTEGEKIVVKGASSLKDGQKVEVI